MGSNRTQRRQIEERILSLARRIDTKDAGWLESDLFEHLLRGWHDLARYYAQSEDTALDAQLLKLYMRFAAHLRRVKEDENIPARQRQQAKASLRDLNMALGGVFNQIERASRAAV